MNTKFKSKELDLSKNGAGDLERLLAFLPKNCACTACTKLKEDAKAKLGKAKYSSIVHSAGITE